MMKMQDLFGQMAVRDDTKEVVFLEESSPPIGVDVAFEKRYAPMERAALFLPVAAELAEDKPALESYMEARVPQIRSSLIEGYLAGKIDGLAKVRKARPFERVRDSVEDAIHRSYAAAKLPAALVVPIRLERGIDCMMNYRGYTERVEVIGSPHVPDGMVYAVSGEAASLAQSPVKVEMSNTYSDYLQSNLVAVRAENRIAFLPYRPESFQGVQTRRWPEAIARFRRRIRSRLHRIRQWPGRVWSRIVEEFNRDDRDEHGHSPEWYGPGGGY